MLKALNSYPAVIFGFLALYGAIALAMHYGIHIPYEYEVGLACIGVAGYAMLDWAVTAIVNKFKKNG